MVSSAKAFTSVGAFVVNKVMTIDRELPSIAKIANPYVRRMLNDLRTRISDPAEDDDIRVDLILRFADVYQNESRNATRRAFVRT